MTLWQARSTRQTNSKKSNNSGLGLRPIGSALHPIDPILRIFPLPENILHHVLINMCSMGAGASRLDLPRLSLISMHPSHDFALRSTELLS